MMLARLALSADLVASLGAVQAVIGAALARRFRRLSRSRAADPAVLPGVTVLKPLHGDEPMLEEALTSFCLQDYPLMQIVFGVQDPADPAIALVRRLQARFPALALDLVVDGTPHGTNRKVANLINMLPVARHEVLVMSDSDIHAAPDYLRCVVAALSGPNVGLVTTLYGGRPASPTLTRRLAAAQLNHNFLPGVLMSRWLGRQDCLGATMAIRRETLQAVGGLRALSPHIADDSALGQLVRSLGQQVVLADTLTVTTTSEASLRELLAHELRWGRTVRSVEPVGYALSSIQLPLFWAGLSVLLTPFSGWSWLVLGAIWAVRAASAATIDRSLRGPATLHPLLLPLRDWLSAAVMIGSLSGRRIAWRGHTLHLPGRALTRNRQVAVPVHAGLAPGVEAGD